MYKRQSRLSKWRGRSSQGLLSDRIQVPLSWVGLELLNGDLHPKSAKD